MTPNEPFPNGKSAFFYCGIEAVRDPAIVDALNPPEPLIVVDSTDIDE